MKMSGMNTATSEMLIDVHGEPDLPRAEQRGLHAAHAGLEMARDVLQHHDGVVHDEASGARSAPSVRDC